MSSEIDSIAEKIIAATIGGNDANNHTNVTDHSK